MITIFLLLKKYFGKIDQLDLELLISAAINKPREFVLTHPEHKLSKSQISNLKSQILRRIKYEPMAYILGKKEFYGLEFKVDKNVLIPRPETEQIVELASYNIKHGTWNRKNKLIVVDIGTGSGNIIISIAKTINKLKVQSLKFKFIGIDISQRALKIARQNAKFHKVSGKIKFLHGNLLEPILKVKSQKSKVKSYILIANLPYLSKKIYSKVTPDIKNYEPRFALLSDSNGLGHYKKLFQQIKMLRVMGYGLRVFLEISPEQKTLLKKAVQSASPDCYLTFLKDLAGKFRVVQVRL